MTPLKLLCYFASISKTPLHSIKKSLRLHFAIILVSDSTFANSYSTFIKLKNLHSINQSFIKKDSCFATIFPERKNITLRSYIFPFFFIVYIIEIDTRKYTVEWRGYIVDKSTIQPLTKSTVASLCLASVQYPFRIFHQCQDSYTPVNFSRHFVLGRSET